jgi:antitoxin MazE
MKAKIQKWGNSLAVRIPKSLASEAHMEQEAVVDLAVNEGKLIIAPTRKRQFSLEELVAGITEENLQKEDIWGPAVGREVW